ncbi:OMP85 family outer membrane protein [Venturia nashicola]|uniref:OMP85 family outer membrane protein n=1 Tax=Venturia nashicola TaxID=86259 RepID=A0A4Z1P9M7_9PEZI|nr:OMP85 family outer membrane protein [Venturia nashicola]
MASPLEEDLFEKLKQKLDPKQAEKRDKELIERIHSQYARQQAREEAIINSNHTLPVTINEVRVLQATHTRRGFLEQIVNPLLSANRDDAYTLLEARQEIDKVGQKLEKFGIYKSPVTAFVDKADPSNPLSTPTDLNVFFQAQERGRYTLKTGTEAGSSEGSAYVDAHLRNIFGGAESLGAHASLGTRTRSSYSALFNTPILSNPDRQFEIGGLVSSTLKPWASHEERLRGGDAKFRWITEGGQKHEFGYSGIWRQITGLAENASPTVRLNAGDSFKSSLTHTWVNDKRDYPLLPSRGYLLKTISEIAGFGPLKGDVGFGKVEVETQGALPIPIPGIAGDSGISFNVGLRGGMLYPLTQAGEDTPIQSRLNDRFQLGGPTDVRGFKISGLGPHENGDAVGGDLYAAGGASLLFPFPRVGKDTPLRLQLFANAGRLLALNGKSKDRTPLSSDDVAANMKKTFEEMRNGLPSCAAGVGIVYAHPMARFELNFSLPLVLRKGEEGRKGVQFGVGISFL